MPMDECNYTCRDCLLPVCRDENPSPMETDLICADCAPDYEEWSA